jgi:hypothetical protein
MASPCYGWLGAPYLTPFHELGEITQVIEHQSADFYVRKVISFRAAPDDQGCRLRTQNVSGSGGIDEL